MNKTKINSNRRKKKRQKTYFMKGGGEFEEHLLTNYGNRLDARINDNDIKYIFKEIIQDFMVSRRKSTSEITSFLTKLNTQLSAYSQESQEYAYSQESQESEPPQKRIKLGGSGSGSGQQLLLPNIMTFAAFLLSWGLSIEVIASIFDSSSFRLYTGILPPCSVRERLYALAISKITGAGSECDRRDYTFRSAIGVA